MTTKRKGELVIYEILIVILVIILIGTILYPKSVWKKLETDTTICRDRMMRISDAEVLYIQGTNEYSDSLDAVLEFVKNSPIFTSDSVMAALRDTFYVKLIVDYFRDYENMATKPATDSAFSLVGNYPDSVFMPIVDRMLDSLKCCPTVGRPYHLTVVDTSAIKVCKISCPINQEDIERANSNFWFHTIGGGKLTNHGKVENGEPSWQPMKRK
ncbi:hypothetical protein DRQ11_07420 [candidate division KSB1 bacterium]|nr:MAG: hypothetical protein DRQ11_07420 [candidate division KSB1 bacterium]HDI51098.1 hypothetical protein [Bacteroidota bacterium]